MTVRRSTYLSLASRHMGVALHLVAIIVISRLLTPAEIGIFTVAAGFVTLSQIIRDTGVGTYLVQEPDLTPRRLSTAMGIALLMGAVLGLLIFALAEPMAVFFREKGVGTVMRVLSITFFLMPINAVGLALLKRELSFGKSFVAETASNFVWAAVAIAAAYWGESYLSMAWASLASVVVLFLALLVLKPTSVLVRPGLAHWRQVLGFSSMVSITQLISQVGLIAPAMILGRLASFSDVAFYNRGDALVRTFRDTVEAGAGAVALSAFSLNLRQGAFDKTGYIYATALITGVSWPFFAVLAVLAYPVIRILFGDQWDAAVPVLQLLAIMNIFHAPMLLAPHVMFAMGALRMALFREACIQGARVILIIILAPYGVEAVAAGQIAIYACALALNQILMRRLVGFTVTDLSTASARSAGVMAITLAGPLAVVVFFPGVGVVWQLFLGATTALVGWLCAIALVNHPLGQEVSLVLRKLASFRVHLGW